MTATVTAKGGERTLFLAEAVQAGIFSVRNVPAEELDPLLGIACPTILFPYLRESISDLITRGGFPPVLLDPVSFEALYMQRLQQGGAQPPGRIQDRTRPVTRVAVLGAGAWGTAIAAVLAARLEVALWARDPTQAAAHRAQARRNERYLPGIALPAAGQNRV